jgi:hypothetical protein
MNRYMRGYKEGFMGKRENFEKFMRARLVPPGREAATIRDGNAEIGNQVVSAEGQIAKLDQIPIENQSALIKYRQNITVPAVWLGEQGIRVSNIPMIPVEKIFNLDRYIQSRLIKIDGGNLDAG